VILGFLWVGFSDPVDLLAENRARESTLPDPINAMAYALGGGLLGARLLFVALHLPYYQDHYLEIIAFWQGGLSASGGMLGLVLGLLFYTRLFRRNLWLALDIVAIPAMLVAISAWIGSWLDGAAYGIKVTPEWVWLMDSDPFQGEVARWPTQGAGLLMSLSAFLLLYRLQGRVPSGVLGTLTFSIFAFNLVVVGLYRADPSLLLLGVRLDVLGPAALTLLGIVTTILRWQKVTESRS
jgi:phosphatidylglycerol:prolipoprotein diacylglycerol transferase